MRLQSFFKIVSLMVAVILLPQCTKATDAHVQVNPTLVSPYTQPASIYLSQANEQTGAQQQSSLINAAGRLIYDGDWRQGSMLLARTSDLAPDQTNEKKLLLAKIDLLKGRASHAIATLGSVREINRLPLYYQVQFHEQLAYAYQTTGHTTESVAERMKLDSLLPDNASKTTNLRALWLSLTSLPFEELNTLLIESEGGTQLHGWMQLVQLSQKSVNAQRMLAAIEQWHAQYPNHPANAILSSTNTSQGLMARPKKLALLLPSTGPLAGPGNAVRDGFMSALEKNNPHHAANVRVYNTDKADVLQLYAQAVNEGADYIVGPLTKADVAAVASIQHSVPTILLNDLTTHTQTNMYQFGLSPTDEAKQVAAKAVKSGNNRALVIAPKGPWGEEIATAFASQLKKNGGRVVDTLHYSTTDNLNASLREFLHIADSEARQKQLKQLLGKKVQSTLRRRHDFNMIFLVSYPTKARQIMPLLNYYYAGNVPIYATSSVYAGNVNPMKDRDLNGIIFCDMPWVFAHQMGNKNWPEQFNSYNRLYALGMDSYALSMQLNQLLLFPAMGVSDKSGVLYLGSHQHIGRILAWGQFKNGVPQRIPGDTALPTLS